MKPLPHLLLTAIAAGTVAFSATALAIDDTAPIDAKPILEALRGIKAQQETTIKTAKQRFIQEASAAAANPARAAELWEEAIRATQFQGVPKENAQFKEWRDKDGEALKDKDVALALHLYFNWLSLTLQRTAGAEVKALFPAILSHVREVANDQVVMDGVDEVIKKEREAPLLPGAIKRPLTPQQKEKRLDLQTMKRVHDQILKGSLGGSAFVQWMHLNDYISGIAPAKGRGNKGRGDRGGAAPADDATPSSWEGTPGNFDGIYEAILLPEMRDAKDLRLLEYWDNKIKREFDAATRTQRQFEMDKYTTVRRPQLIWSRDEDLAKIGQRNRALTDMFAQIKAFPNHPDAAGWISELEQMLTPAPPASIATPDPAPATAATVPGAQ